MQGTTHLCSQLLSFLPLSLRLPLWNFLRGDLSSLLRTLLIHDLLDRHAGSETWRNVG